MKSITWIGEERTLPGIGLATEGKTFEVADGKADSYVDQKLAKYTKVNSKASKTQEDK